MQPFEITVTNQVDGYSPTTTNASATTMKSALEEAEREAGEHPFAVITIWERVKIEPHRCDSCHQTTSRPFRYEARAVFVNSVKSQSLSKAKATA